MIAPALISLPILYLFLYRCLYGQVLDCIYQRQGGNTYGIRSVRRWTEQIIQRFQGSQRTFHPRPQGLYLRIRRKKRSRQDDADTSHMWAAAADFRQLFPLRRRKQLRKRYGNGQKAHRRRCRNAFYLSRYGSHRQSENAVPSPGNTVIQHYPGASGAGRS